jgi:hypothetical protein
LQKDQQQNRECHFGHVPEVLCQVFSLFLGSDDLHARILQPMGPFIKPMRLAVFGKRAGTVSN